AVMFGGEQVVLDGVALFHRVQARQGSGQRNFNSRWARLGFSRCPTKFVGAGLGASVNFSYQYATSQPGQSIDWSSVVLGGVSGFWTSGATLGNTVGYNMLTSYSGSVMQGQNPLPGMAGAMLGSVVGYKVGGAIASKLEPIYNPFGSIGFKVTGPYGIQSWQGPSPIPGYTGTGLGNIFQEGTGDLTIKSVPK
ncbi:hypothetical protein, partial [Chromobacterium haemolyticum]|uniref:hypothetical protein n=1 Tax=Chromobacterium haemolyticum TaxID=394935 RepID=UPI001C636CF4